MLDGRPWPRITIITPSYNRERFVEETIRSVLLQGYPDLEYMVIDGGSTAGTLETIRRYARWLAYWVSEPDRGSGHAVNKGLRRTTGALLAVLCSDDYYLPGALRAFAEAHVRRPDALLLGDVENFREGEPGTELSRQTNVTFRSMVEQGPVPFVFHFPGVFVPYSLYRVVGGLDDELRLSDDRDWLCRLTMRAEAAYLGVPVARFRIHGDNASGQVLARLEEGFRVTQRYWDLVPGLDKRRVRATHALRVALVYLAHNSDDARFWDRRAGVRHLLAAGRQDPRLVFSPHFLRLCRRALLPKRWLRSNSWKPR